MNVISVDHTLPRDHVMYHSGGIHISTVAYFHTSEPLMSILL